MRRARRVHSGDHAENHERWLVSYADFITLMFAFFVVMFASSNSDKQKARDLSDSVTRALDENGVKTKLMTILGGTTDGFNQGTAYLRGPKTSDKNQKATPAGSLAELTPSLITLSEELKKEVKAGKVHISLQPRGLVISLQDAAFFPSGGDTLAPDCYPSIAKVANGIVKLPNPVRVEGHTDSQPIHNERFRSNWQLSAARSIAMLDALITRFGVPAERLSVVGYASNIAVADNSTPEGRARNRRVDITILNQVALVNEAQASAGTVTH